MTNFDGPRPGSPPKDRTLPARRDPSSPPDNDGIFTVSDPRGRDLTIFSRDGNASYRISPLDQQPVRQGFLVHGDRMLDILSAHVKQRLLRDLLRAVRVGKDPQTITDLKRMIEQTINHTSNDPQRNLTPEVMRDELLDAIRVADSAAPSKRIRAANLTVLIEIAEMMTPQLPLTVETAEQITATFSHSINLLSESMKEKAEQRTRDRARAAARASERERIVSVNQKLDALRSHINSLYSI